MYKVLDTILIRESSTTIEALEELYGLGTEIPAKVYIQKTQDPVEIEEA